MQGKPSGRLDNAQVGGAHYAQMTISPWEFLEVTLTHEEFVGYLKGEALVYIARERAKGGAVDISKARHVLQKLEEVQAKQPSAQTRAPALPSFTALGMTADEWADFARRVRNAGSDLGDVAATLGNVARLLRGEGVTLPPSGPQAPANGRR